MDDILYNLYSVVEGRRENPQEGSYTCYLLDKGTDKILKKVGEEATETVIAVKNGDKGEIVSETCDLIYHLMVMLVNEGVEIGDIYSELDKRSKKIGNLKEMRETDKNT